MERKVFYRVGNIETNQGLWYDWNGEYTGLIHNEFDFCENKDLPMPYDEKLVGWLSATNKLEELWYWFPKEDIFRLQKHGWYLYTYLAKKWKTYKNHVVIEQKTSFPLLRIEIHNNLEIGNIKEIQSPQRAAFNTKQNMENVL